MNMPGGFSANMAEKAHDPFHARALVLDDGKTTLAMVVVDNIGAGPDVLNEAKAHAAAKTGRRRSRCSDVCGLLWRVCPCDAFAYAG